MRRVKLVVRGEVTLGWNVIKGGEFIIIKC